MLIQQKILTSHVRRPLLSGLVLFASACMALAEPPEPPAPIADWPGIYHGGSVSNLEIWRIPGTDEAWIETHDGDVLIRGHVLIRPESRPTDQLYSSGKTDQRDAMSDRLESQPHANAPLSPVPWSDADQEDLAGAYDVTQNSTFWLALGDSEAPAVWVWLDPASPASSDAFLSMRPALLAGDIALRVIMVMTSHDQSRQVMETILSGENQHANLIAQLEGRDQEADTARGHGDVDFETMLVRVAHNGEIANALALPALPFFFWSGQNGIRAFAGIPDDSLVDTILADMHGDATDAIAGQGENGD